MDDWHGRDLLSSVHEVCRLHWRKRGQPDVQIEELETAGLAYLRISYTHGPWTKHQVLGVFDGEPDEPALRRLRSLAGAADAELIFRGAKPTEPMCELARNSRIWLRGVEEYQSGLCLRTQNTRLTGDPEYPLAPHVDKTFLLRTIAHELAARDGLIPVLITMRDLEKGRTLDELPAQHMARHDEDPFHGSAFRYLLREGRIALLFDGFDELALRTSYERVPQHFATLREAAAGAAKVVVTSRHQYFATDQSIRNSLGDDVHRLPGSRIIRLAPLESAQRRELVVRTFDDNRAADEFMEALRNVPNLLDLATNPRMLAFMIRWYREGILTRAALAQSADRRMTAGTLYELLLTRWLSHEVARQTAIGGLKPLSVERRMDALTETAMRMWRTGRRSLALDDPGEIAERISDLARLEMRPGEAVQTVGSSTVLVRTADNEFAFIHQSVMEWFVAYVARQAFSQGHADEVLANHELTSPMVDFMCDLAGPDIVIEWARDIAARDESPGPVAKANASLVLQRRSVQATAVNYAGQDLIWDTSSCQPVTTLKTRSGRLTAIAASSMANWVAAGWQDGTIRLWQTTNEIPVHTLAGHTGLVTSVAVDPSGDMLTTADSAAIRRWTYGAGMPPIRAMTKAACDGWLASAHFDGTIHVWHLTSQSPGLRFSAGRTTALATLLSSESGWAAWMPDGRFKIHDEPAGLWWATGLCRFNARRSGGTGAVSARHAPSAGGGTS
jgi:hypothetical protein